MVNIDPPQPDNGDENSSQEASSDENQTQEAGLGEPNQTPVIPPAQTPNPQEEEGSVSPPETPTATVAVAPSSEGEGEVGQENTGEGETQPSQPTGAVDPEGAQKEQVPAPVVAQNFPPSPDDEVPPIPEVAHDTKKFWKVLVGGVFCAGVVLGIMIWILSKEEPPMLEGEDPSTAEEMEEEDGVGDMVEDDETAEGDSSQDQEQAEDLAKIVYKPTKKVTVDEGFVPQDPLKGDDGRILSVPENAGRQSSLKTRGYTY